MANINKQRRTTPIRADPEFEKIVKQVMASNLNRGKIIRIPRVTLAMARQYRKYPNLLKELEDAKLE
jgi:hypothetical protein